jgi:hypothetical protein
VSNSPRGPCVDARIELDDEGVSADAAALDLARGEVADMDVARAMALTPAPPSD